MTDIRRIVAGNLSELRTQNGMTQIELAEKLHYSDKAVSKWERGESLPDIAVLKNIAELFGVTLDYLVQEEPETAAGAEREERAALPGEQAADAADDAAAETHRKKRDRAFITGMSILLVWLVAAFTFVVLDIAPLDINSHWLAYLYAVPVSMIVWIVLNSIWFDRRLNFLIVSLLMWSVILCVFFTCLFYGAVVWQVFILGVPAQAIIILWSRLKRK